MKIGIDTTFLIAYEVLSHPGHRAMRDYLSSALVLNDSFALTPQVLLEFVHIVTDPNRFENPVSIPQAVNRANMWWNGMEIEQVYPTDHAVSWFFQWMNHYALGRKRILDTMLAATYFTGGVEAIVTVNARDFDIFPELKVITPAGP